jgi:hypothetical protein
VKIIDTLDPSPGGDGNKAIPSDHLQVSGKSFHVFPIARHVEENQFVDSFKMKVLEDGLQVPYRIQLEIPAVHKKPFAQQEA